LSITTIPLIESFTLPKKIYLISGSPKCPFAGLTGGEIGLGIIFLSFKKHLFSIAQKINQFTAVALLVLLG
jgi:hypothetical protein